MARSQAAVGQAFFVSHGSEACVDGIWQAAEAWASVMGALRERLRVFGDLVACGEEGPDAIRCRREETLEKRVSPSSLVAAAPAAAAHVGASGVRWRLRSVVARLRSSAGSARKGGA